MFKICYVKLNYTDSTIEPSFYHFNEIVYIYGANSVGKTIMLQAIDYALGKTDFVLENKDGLGNIDSIEIKLVNESSTLILCRTKDNNFGYKYSDYDAEFLNVNGETYKQVITSFVIGKDAKCFEEFKNYLGEESSFRSFIFINFLDEKGLGNLTNIFPRINNYYNQKRAFKLMTFVFNYKNVSKLLDLMKEREEIKHTLKGLNEQKATYKYLMCEIVKEFKDLQIPIKPDATLDDLRQAFDLFNKNFTRDESRHINEASDLGVLLRISCALSEELKYQENLKKQTKFLSARNKKSEKLLAAFKELVMLDENYSIYVDNIESLIQKQQLSYDVLSLKDFDKTIKEIEIKKADIDKQIESCSAGLNKGTYEHNIKAIGRLEQALSSISGISDIQTIENNEERLGQIDKEIKKIRNEFDYSLKEKFDKTMLMFYNELDQIGFVKDDLKQTKFKILFDPVKIAIYGERLEDNSNDISEVYFPGSMARETTWQILAYLSMFKLFKEDYKDLPLMPVLFIDGLDQPYDDQEDSYSTIYQFVRNKSLELGIQLFVVSTRDLNSVKDTERLHIKGFNKSYKR